LSRSIRFFTSRRQQGFTLLEILLVLTIIALGSMVIVPNLTGMESRTFNTQVRDAHTLLNHARRMAVVSGRPSIASFSAGTRNEDDEDAAPESLLSVGHWHADNLSLTFRDSADQEVEVEDLLEITFYPEGGSSGGSLILALDERVATVMVNPFTGRVETEFDNER
jgi:general secretion pathway protein H